MRWVKNDGGRAAAGFQGVAGDCVTRAIAIATGLPYRQVYHEVAAACATYGKARSARNGVPKAVTKEIMRRHGGKWVPTMGIGTGTQVHLDPAELPSGIIVARLSKHVVAVKDGIVHDTYDPSRDGSRCVYGYWEFK